MKKTYLLLSVLAISVLIVAGCINYDQDMTLEADNSGTVKIHYTNAGQGQEGVPDLPFVEEDIVASYDGAGVEVYDIEIVTAEGEETATPEATYYVDFKNVEDLNGYGIFAIGDDIVQTISVTDEGDTRTYVQTCTLNMTVDEETDLSAYTFNYTLTLPTPVVETNGTIQADGQTVKWTFPLGDLVNNTTTMTVTYEKPKGGGGCFGGCASALLGSSFALFGVIAIVFSSRRKKKKKA
ncbi:MAG: hypothetical protein GY771_17255 [bacterium]|nr:hypothetical protein [bacterium]